jgi:hypothetical protein
MYESYQGPRTGLIAEDLARLQALYGPRQSVGNEGALGNDSFATATPLSILNGQPLQAPTQADITTQSDKDVYKINVGLNVGPFSVQVQTSGISSLVPRVTVYDSSFHVVNSVVAPDPMHGDVTVHINPPLLSLLGTTYYVQVQSGTNDVFGIGSYQLQLKPDSIVSVGGLVNLVSDVGNTLTSALLLPQLYPQTNARFDYMYRASIGSSSDVDYYKFKSPTPPSGTPNVMTAMLWASQANGLDGQLGVYDANGNPIAVNILTHENGTTVVQLPNAAASTYFYVSVSAANPSGSHATGDYFLGIDFSAIATGLQTLATNQTPGSSASPGPVTLNASTDLLAHFVLSASGANVPAGAAMEMDIYDQNGNVVYTLIAAAGQSQSLTCYLAQGQYMLSFKAINTNGGAVAPLFFTLAGIDLSDPINPYQSNPTSSPSGSSSSPPSSSSPTSPSTASSSSSSASSSTTW